MWVGTGSARAANPFYDKPSDAAQVQIKSWGTMYTARMATGAAATSAGSFSYTDAKMNSALFAPDVAAIRVVSSAKYGVNSAADCNQVAGVTIDEKTQQLTMGKVSADMTGNPTYFVALLDAVLSDPTADMVIEGESLIASGLTVPPDVGVLGAKTYANASAETLGWIGGLGVYCGQVAAGLDHSDDAKRRLTGDARGVDQIEAAINEWAHQNGVSLGTYQVEALFGSYGALPVIVCAYGWGDGSAGPEHGFILVDGVNGNVDGPFVSRTAINPSALLESHGDAYQGGTGVTVVRVGTLRCAPVASTRTPYPTVPGPGFVPPGLIPVPATPVNPTPGKPEPWKCTTTTVPSRPDPNRPGSPTNPIIPAGSCVCKSIWHYVPGGTAPAACPPGHTFPALCDIKYEVICFEPLLPGSPPLQCNGGPNTTPAPTPPTAPGISVPGTGSPPMSPTNPATTCIENWWYWS